MSIINWSPWMRLFERREIVSICRRCMHHPRQDQERIADGDQFDRPEDCAPCRKELAKRRKAASE